VAAALAQAGAAGVSGEAVAAGLGISRAAVHSHVEALRRLGYEISSSPRVGYRLLSAPDLCIPEEVWPRLADVLWVSCVGGPVTGSTNDEAKRLARAGAAEGTVVAAAAQTQGRGRMGRQWESPRGGAYVSCILRPTLPPSALSALPLAAAAGLARGLGTLGMDVLLKWPNDVESRGRKLAGILVEMAAETDRVEWVVIGCGINVADRPHSGAACVRDVAPAVGSADVAAAVLDGIAGVYREFLARGFEPLREEYEARSSLTGCDVRVREHTGSVVAEGRVAGVDPDGALVLHTPDGQRRIVSGEVTLRD
jgi:BirA family biotin operon repressor/biotin-[acetyl-CoA-carboxylase] ligase